MRADAPRPDAPATLPARSRGAPRPGTFVVGAPRCGTTALVDFLGQHPDVFVPFVKEPHHFGSDLTTRRGFETEEAYLELFADAGARHPLEGSTWYLYSRRAAREIAAFAPEARIVVMLRDPVELLRSWHAHVVLLGLEEIESFEEALAAESDRREGRRVPPGTPVEKLLYREIPRFAEQLERYLAAFGAERVRVVLHEDFRADNRRVVADLFAFIGVDPAFEPSFETVNAHARVRSRMFRRLLERQPPLVRRAVRSLVPHRTRHALRDALRSLNTTREPPAPIGESLAAALRREYADEVERLGALIGRDLRHWSQGGQRD
jgi:hypothetical protein